MKPTKPTRLTLRKDAPVIVWGQPNSVPRSLCAMCHGGLPMVPFMLWKANGACASFCDNCVEKHFEFAP